MDRTAHIVGTATTPMQRRDLSIEEMAHKVVADALSDAGMTPDQVDLVIVGNATAGRLLNQACIRGQSFLLDAGLSNAGIINVDNSCAGGASALHLANLSTLGGAGTVLAVGVEKMWTGHRMETLAGIEDGVPEADRMFMHDNWENPSGSVLMALNAKWTLEHMEAWGTTVEQIGAAAVKAREHGALNPHAQFQSEVTLEEVLTSSPIVPPLTRLMCSSFTDGAAAVVLTLEARAGAPRILASTARSGNGDIDYHDRLAETAAAAWDAGGRRPGRRRRGRAARRHQCRGDLRTRVAGLLQTRRRRSGDSGRRHHARGQGSDRQHQRRPGQPGSPARGDRHRPGGRTRRPAARRGRSSPGPWRPIGGGGQHRWHDRIHAGITDAAFIGIHVLEAG